MDSSANSNEERTESSSSNPNNWLDRWNYYVGLVNWAPKQLKTNPFHSKINQEAVQLAQRYGKKYHSTLTWLSAYVYSYLDEDSFRLANQWHLWLWLFDDLVDNPDLELSEKVNLTEEAVSVIQNNFESSVPLLQLLHLTKSKLKDRLTPRVFNYWLTETSNYLTKGVLVHLTTPPMTLQQYQQVRYFDGACNTAWPMMMLDCPVDLDLNELSVYNQVANQLVSLTNDFFSYPKDTLIEGTTFNYLTKYQEETGASLDKTILDLLATINSRYIFLLGGRQQLSGISLKYLERLIQWCQGSWLWHSQSPRYNFWQKSSKL